MLRGVWVAVNDRALLGPPASGTGMVEMNVRDEDVPDPRWIKPARTNRGEQRAPRGRRPGLNEGELSAAALHEVRGDDAGRVLKKQVQRVKRHPGESEFEQVQQFLNGETMAAGDAFQQAMERACLDRAMIRHDFVMLTISSKMISVLMASLNGAQPGRLHHFFPS
jgi:hypothetical protein